MGLEVGVVDLSRGDARAERVGRGALDPDPIFGDLVGHQWPISAATPRRLRHQHGSHVPVGVTVVVDRLVLHLPGVGGQRQCLCHGVDPAGVEHRAVSQAGQLPRHVVERVVVRVRRDEVGRCDTTGQRGQRRGEHRHDSHSDRTQPPAAHHDGSRCSKPSRCGIPAGAPEAAPTRWCGWTP